RAWPARGRSSRSGATSPRWRRWAPPTCASTPSRTTWRARATTRRRGACWPRWPSACWTWAARACADGRGRLLAAALRERARLPHRRADSPAEPGAGAGPAGTRHEPDRVAHLARDADRGRRHEPLRGRPAAGAGRRVAQAPRGPAPRRGHRDDGRAGGRLLRVGGPRGPGRLLPRGHPREPRSGADAARAGPGRPGAGGARAPRVHRGGRGRSGRVLAHRLLGRRPQPRLDRAADVAAPRLRPLLRRPHRPRPPGHPRPLAAGPSATASAATAVKGRSAARGVAGHRPQPLFLLRRPVVVARLTRLVVRQPRRGRIFLRPPATAWRPGSHAPGRGAGAARGGGRGPGDPFPARAMMSSRTRLGTPDRVRRQATVVVGGPPPPPARRARPSPRPDDLDAPHDVVGKEP